MDLSFGSDFFGSNPYVFFPSASPAPTPSSSSGGGSSTTDWLNTIFKFAQLGTQTYLAQDALNSKTPATIFYGPNGQPIVSGGGASSPALGLGSVGSISPLLVIIIIAVVLLMLFRK